MSYKKLFYKIINLKSEKILLYRCYFTFALKVLTFFLFNSKEEKNKNLQTLKSIL